jgi:WD40 repeat protein
LIRQYDADWKERGEGKIPGSFVSVDPAGRRAVSREDFNEPGVGRTDQAVLWDLSRLETDGAKKGEVLTIGKHPGAFVPVFQEFFPDGKRLVTVHDTGRLAVWDVASRQRLAESNEVVRNTVSALALSPKGSLLATVQIGNQVALWDASQGGVMKRVREPWSFPGAVHSLAFDPNGTFLATANANGSVYLLRIRGK